MTKDARTKLTEKQARFAAVYIGEAIGNQTQAARLAGYKGTDAYLNVIGYKLVRNGKVQAEIARLRAQQGPKGVEWWRERVIERFEHCTQPRDKDAPGMALP
jgi:hypothetical protein